MQGISKCRYGGPNDPLVQEMMKEKGLTEVPMYRTDGPKAEKFDLNACMQRWMAYNPNRDGPVNVDRPEGDQPSHISDLIRAKAIELGGSDAGYAQLTPIMVNILLLDNITPPRRGGQRKRTTASSRRVSGPGTLRSCAVIQPLKTLRIGLCSCTNGIGCPRASGQPIPHQQRRVRER